MHLVKGHVPFDVIEFGFDGLAVYLDLNSTRLGFEFYFGAISKRSFSVDLFFGSVFVTAFGFAFASAFAFTFAYVSVSSTIYASDSDYGSAFAYSLSYALAYPISNSR